MPKRRSLFESGDTPTMMSQQVPSTQPGVRRPMAGMQPQGPQQQQQGPPQMPPITPLMPMPGMNPMQMSTPGGGGPNSGDLMEALGMMRRKPVGY